MEVYKKVREYIENSDYRLCFSPHKIEKGRKPPEMIREEARHRLRRKLRTSD